MPHIQSSALARHGGVCLALGLTVEELAVDSEAVTWHLASSSSLKWAMTFSVLYCLGLGDRWVESPMATNAKVLGCIQGPYPAEAYPAQGQDQSTHVYDPTAVLVFLPLEAAVSS